LFLISSLISCAFCYKDDSKNLKLTEFGYIGEYWDTHTITLSVKFKNRKYHYKYCVLVEEYNKILIEKEGIVDNSNILEFYKFIIRNKILKLKSASLFDSKTNSDYFESVYKKFNHQLAFIYAFYFIIDKKKYSFKVDDIKNILEPKYLILLKKMNEIPEKPSFLTILDFTDYLNKILNK
jgi:hypothetical protein